MSIYLAVDNDRSEVTNCGTPLSDDAKRMMETVIEPFAPRALYQEVLKQSGWDLFTHRKRYTQRHGWHLVSAEQCDTLTNFLKGMHVLDAGCGTGFMTSMLRARGVQTTAVDQSAHPHAVISDIVAGDAAGLLPGEFDAVLLCWPPYDDPFARQVLEKMAPGQFLLYQGESKHGCTGDDAFHELLTYRLRRRLLQHVTDQLNDNHVKFFGIHDYWSVYQIVR